MGSAGRRFSIGLQSVGWRRRSPSFDGQGVPTNRVHRSSRKRLDFQSIGAGRLGDERYGFGHISTIGAIDAWQPATCRVHDCHHHINFLLVDEEVKKVTNLQAGLICMDITRRQRRCPGIIADKRSGSWLRSYRRQQQGR